MEACSSGVKRMPRDWARMFLGARRAIDSFFIMILFVVARDGITIVLKNALVNIKNVNMSMFGERLRKERQRLGMNQDEFSAVGGVKKRAQISYEKDERSPDAAYLLALLEIGVDVWYVLTGQVSTATLTAEENELLVGYRGLDTRGRFNMLGMLDVVGAAAPAPTVTPSTVTRHNIGSVQFLGEVGGITNGDQHTAGDLNVGVVSKKKKKDIRE